MEFHQGLGYEKACRLSNTTHSEIAPSLSLPSLPVCFGSAEQKLGLFDEPAGSRAADRPEVLAHASTVAEFLSNCDVRYLNLKENAKSVSDNMWERSRLYQEALKHNPAAFESSFRVLKDTGPALVLEQRI